MTIEISKALEELSISRAERAIAAAKDEAAKRALTNANIDCMNAQADYYRAASRVDRAREALFRAMASEVGLVFLDDGSIVMEETK